MKKSIIFTLILVITLFSFTSFVGFEKSSMDTPGRIEFIGEAGSPNVFTFQKWNFEEVSVPDGDFEQVQLSLSIHTGSLKTEWKDLEKSIRKKKDYFYAKKFPKATVAIDGAQKQADGSYKTEAILTLKGVSKPVELTFRVSDSAPYQVEGEGVIIRQKFKFTGGGPKNEVPVKFNVTLPGIGK